MSRLRWDMHANPIANSSTPFERSLSALNPTSANFSTIEIGGYGQAELEFTGVPLALIEEALQTWMMKRVTASDSASNLPYEGFITDITAEVGHHSYTKSVDGFFNRAFVTYPYSGSPCQPGATCYKDAQINETDIDATYDSQTQIGIKEEWFDESNTIISLAAATSYGKQKMSKVLKPLFASFNLGGGSSPSENTLSITMLGAYATLQWRKHKLNFHGQTGQSEISDMLKLVLSSGSKAQYINTEGGTFPQMAGTGRSTQYNTSGNATWMQNYIQDICEIGSSTNRRIIFQIGAGRIPYLYTQGNAPTYYSRARDKNTYDTDRGAVPAYMVKAGGYIQAENLTAPLDETTDVVGRGRGSLVEQTTYDCIADTLSIPAPSSLLDTRRILAGERKRRRGKR